MSSIFSKIGTWVKGVWENNNLFNLGNKQRAAVLGLIALLILGLTGWCSAHGAEQEFSKQGMWVQVEAGSTFAYSTAPVLGVQIAQPLPITRFNAYVEVGMFDVGKSTINGQPVENNLVWRAVLCSNFVSNFDACIGPSYMDNPAPLNGTRTNAALQLDYRFKKIPLTISFEHYSCAGSCSPNDGLNMVTAGIRF